MSSEEKPLAVRFSPEVTVPAELDEGAVMIHVRELVRGHHGPPEQLPHEGPPVEAVVVTGIIRIERGWRIQFSYLLDLYPSSRYDKSRTAAGWLHLSPDASKVLRTNINPIKDPWGPVG